MYTHRLKFTSREEIFLKSVHQLSLTCTGEALAYPPMVMGTENCSMKTGSVPSFPGNTKSKRDQSSFRLFCMGEPERMNR